MDQAAIIAALEARGLRQVDVCKTLGLTSSRVHEIYAGRRKITLSEAVKLITTHGLDGVDRAATESPNSTVLFHLLRAILRRSQKPETVESTARVTAEALAYGLELVARNPAIRENADALAAVGDAAADRTH